jgi:hypothetical protein
MKLEIVDGPIDGYERILRLSGLDRDLVRSFAGELSALKSGHSRSVIVGAAQTTLEITTASKAARALHEAPAGHYRWEVSRDDLTTIV